MLSASLNNNIHDLTNGPMSDAGHNLLSLYLDYRGAQRSGTLHTFTANSTHIGVDNGLAVRGDNVGIQIHVKGDLGNAARAFEKLGMVITSIDVKDSVIAGDFPITLLRQLSIRLDVISVRPLSVPVLHSVGEAPDQADATLKASLARNNFTLTGRGVDVGVISDSVNAVGNGLQDSVATGDLPNNVTDLVDGTAAGDTDEGRAVLEEIHDLAPQASLFFASADAGQQGFVSSVQQLVAAGCTVIVDDVGFTDEPFFQPGIIDKAINTAVAAGVTFISASGNDANNGFLQAAHFVPATTPTGTTDQLINFNPGGAAATRMGITISAGGTLTLEWDDPYNGVTGTVKSDLDIYFYNAAGNTLLYSSTDNNFNTGVPVESLQIPAGSYQVEIRAKNTTTANLPGYYAFNGDFTMTSTQYTGIRSSIVGHAGLSNAISVGAVPFYDAPPYSTATPIPTESFSTAGPAVQTRDANGVLLASPVTIQKPDISGTDQNNTSFFGTVIPQTGNNLPSFSGTSSAAGNVAGVVALIKQEFPNETEAQILAAFKATAVPVNGQTAGTWDPVGGFGLIDANAAIVNLGGNTASPLASIQPIVPNPTSSPVNSIDIDFNEVVTGVSISDFSLSLDGGSNLLGKTSPTLTTTNGKDYVLGNLYSVTGTPGDYILKLTAAASGIAGSLGQALTTDATVSWTKLGTFIVPNQPTKLGAVGISQASISLNWRDNSTNEDTYSVQYSTNPSFQVNVKTIVLPPNSTQYTIGRLGVGMRYYFRVFASNSSGDSYFSGTATAATFSRGEITLDNTNSSRSGVSVIGSWTPSTAISGFVGPNYLQDDNTGKGTKSVIYKPKLIKGGDYFIYATWTRASDRAKSVPFDIFSSSGVLLDTVLVNERNSGGNGWALIGKFALHSGAGAAVRISNKGTKGEVIADAVRFLPAVAIPGAAGT